MANPVWFNENDYLASKLAQLQKAGNTQFSTLVQVKSAIEAAGYSVFNHFQQFSLTEGTSPNAFFNADEYLAAKAAQLNALPGNTTAWTAQMVAVAIKNAGFTTVYEHFSTHGWLENVNPSNSFDVSAYFAAKLAALQAAEPSAGWTEQKVKDAFKAAGFDPISHYAAHGKTEGVAVAAVPAGEQVAGGVAGTFTLTTSANNFVGTAGNDTFDAGLVSATTPANDTLTLTDVLNGGAGTDVLNVSVEGASNALGGATISNIETINVRSVTGAAATVDASAAVGVTNVNANTGAGTLAVTKLATGAAFTVTGNGTVDNGEASFAYATATNAVTLNVAGGTKMTGEITVLSTGLTGGADAANGTATSATINSTGAANVVGDVDLANATLTSVTVNAATNLKGGFLANANDEVAANGVVTIAGAATTVEFTAALDNDVKTIDASGLTAGGFKGILGTGITSFKGGAGADSITTAATTATGAVIDGGAGTDTLTLAAVNDVTTAAKGAQYVNFETLGLNASQDVSLVAGITALELNAMTSQTISKISAAQAGAITVKGNQTIGVVLTLADATGTADVVSLALKSDTATTNVDVAGLSVIGVETLNVAATTGTAGTASDLAFAAGGADKLTAINISGTADVALVGTNTAKAVTVNSTTSGVATISGNFVNASTITTGAGKDVITLGTGFATYNTGAGDDTINGTAAQLNTGADYNVINGGEGTDTLNITGGVALNIVDNNLSKITGIEKIVVATTTTNAQSIQTGGFFDAAFKATGVDLTTTSTTGAITIDMTSFTGAATLTTTSTTGDQTIQTGTAGGNDKVTVVATTGDVIVSTGAGDDVVSVTTAGTGIGEGAITITTGAGNDTITVVNATAGDNATITAGAGADKITLGTDAAKVVIGNTDSGIAVATADSITGFVSGTHTIALGFNGGATNATEAAAVVADFATALTNANAALAALKVANPASTELANFQWDATNGYLFNDTNADGTADQVIVLVGITGATFAVADIVA